MRSSSPAAVEVQFAPLLAEHIDAVVQIEQRAYAHPWNRTNFADALQSGYQAQMLLAEETVLGYFVAMEGVEEVHLLNITVAPEFQRQGWSRIMLDALTLWARGRQAQWLWLEVRVGNTRAMHVYEAQGYARVGVRKDYYPAGHGKREDAVVMGLKLV
ncbi:ribosomal protein S18-alanine N-acetyltransferase [Rhodoferax sp. AJA081-3]|uniref:ribosomal protein S18-alanine N-acetyltransferase n=1 Tax=Rhodoferax sp. AJA081-3 TaxID=2752316 RepID=UPI001ADF8B09|nr:ribosomal protein S18-alanine N-acetyltransferase [Rhodoferax sp. AJA081-3]QTN26823.1 ribosomal protein S18-alanine N-acetyltransferase [Rhodoferax sp. AJA081-3]